MAASGATIPHAIAIYSHEPIAAVTFSQSLDVQKARSDSGARSGHDVYQLISAPNVGTISLNISLMNQILISPYKKKNIDYTLTASQRHNVTTTHPQRTTRTPVAYHMHATRTHAARTPKAGHANPKEE